MFSTVRILLARLVRHTVSFRRPLGITLFVVFVFPVNGWGLSVVNMTTNGRVNPLGIGGKDISLAWSIKSGVRDTVQRAYQVQLGSGQLGEPLWDSGRVESAQQVDVCLPDSIRILAAKPYFWKVRIWDGNGNASDWSAPAWFETGLLTPEDWGEAKWIGRPPAPKEAAVSLPLLRGEITLPKAVKTARLFASAQGVYKLSINGHKVGDQFLAPGWTDYPQRIQAQTYDVTGLLQKGSNVIGAALGDGWYRGHIGLHWSGVYGERLALISVLKVTYADDTVATFVSDEQWRTSSGPYIQADLQDGETYDARLEQTGWDLPDFHAASWSPVCVESKDLRPLTPQPDEPVRVTGVLAARLQTEPKPGEFVYDLGQNMVGVARVRLSGKRGQTVRIRYAEELYRLGEHRGRLYTDNFRKAKVTDTYTFARDETVFYQPTFTQHGFRFVEITGVDKAPALSEVEGVVLGSDLPKTGELRLAQPMLDQLVRNISWGQRGNFLSIPTDTPARDERLGWTGDISVFVPTACRFQDTRAFLSKWMDDLRDAQREDGNIPAIVPQPRREFDVTGVGWSDAFITVPYAVWRATGDTRILRRNWEAMRRFYRFVHTSATQDGNLLEEGRRSWFSGDWLHLETVDGEAEHRVIATAYFAEDTRMMAEMAKALGEEALAKEWTALVPKIRAAFVAAYRAPDGTLYTGTQTVYALALGMDLIADAGQRAQTAAKFVEKLGADNYHLKTGFLGTPWLLPALSKSGRNDLAMRLLLNEDSPSWGFEIRMGATTMWERWDSIRANGEFGPDEMNSFNHYAYGAVGDWMFQYLGGIQILGPGYKTFRVAPLVGHDALKHSHCFLQTPYGEIACGWTTEEKELQLSLMVPVNTNAEVILPAPSLESVREGDSPIVSAPGVAGVVFNDGCIRFHAGSGSYRFTVRRGP